jgi:hypothetical protein
MALTASEKQRRYREKHLGIDGQKVRLQAFVSVSCEGELKRLAAHHGYSLTKMIEVLARDAESDLLDTLPSSEHKAYYDGWKANAQAAKR